MNLKPVYLLAGGRNRRTVTPDPLIQTAFKESGTMSPVIAYIGVANGDNEGFFSRMAGLLLENGAGKVNHALVIPKDADLERAKKTLESSDIIFVSGGDVEFGMKVLEEKGLVRFLSGLYRQGKPLFGVSAGSIMLGKEWVRWRDPDDDSTAELFPCLGFAPVICDTHDEEGGWEELKMALKLEPENTIGYGIPSGTAIRVFPNGVVEALGEAIHRYVKQKNRVERLADLPPAG